MITAIIVNYFSHEITSRAALSVLNDVADAQIIVVDNSSDAEEAQRLKSALPASIDYIINDENVGFGRACNQAFTQAEHDWILLLNPDAYILTGCIETLADFLRHTPKAAAVAPRVYWNKEHTWLLPPAQLPTPANEFLVALALRWPWFGKSLGQHLQSWAKRCISSLQPVRQKMLSGGNMLLRRSAVAAVGGLFDPDFFMYYEDADLCCRLHRAGFEMYLLPNAHAVHEWCAIANKEQLSQSSRQLYFDKRYPNHFLSRFRELLEQKLPAQNLMENVELGIFNAPFSFPMPANIPQTWLLQVSPHPLLFPALYHYGTDDECRIPEDLWQMLGSGHYWADLSDFDNQNSLSFHWQIAPRSDNA